MGSLFKRVVPVAGLLLLLSGCGFAVESSSSEGGGLVVEEQTAGGAAGACLEGTEDCVDADLGGGDLEEPVLDGDFELEAARRDAESLLGVAEQDLETAADVRIERKGDEEFMLTMDLMPGRKNLQLDEDADGVYRVTAVGLELPDGGVEVFEAN